MVNEFMSATSKYFPHSSLSCAIVGNGCLFACRGFVATCSIVIATLAVHQEHQTGSAGQMEVGGDYLSEFGTAPGRCEGWRERRPSGCQTDQIYF